MLYGIGVGWKEATGSQTEISPIHEFIDSLSEPRCPHDYRNLE